MDNQIAIQYREILERFNKIIWTHKIHLCQADIYLAKRKKRNLILSILSALVSASAITNIFKWLPEIVIVPLIAFLSLFLRLNTRQRIWKRKRQTTKDLQQLCMICVTDMPVFYLI